MELSEFLPRQFLVKAVQRELGRLPKGFSMELQSNREMAASRIATAIEDAAEIFSGNDDPMPVPSRERERILGPQASPPQSPEDIGHEGDRAERPLLRLPQPESVIVHPDSEEGKAVMSNPGRSVRPIRPQRAGAAQDGECETPNWDYNHLYASVMGSSPMSIRVTPDGQSGEIELERSFQADPASGIVKLIYQPPLQQKESARTQMNPDGGELPAMSVPVAISHTFSIFDPVSVDFDKAVFDLKSAAKKSFRPRPTSVMSSTPVIPGRTLEGAFSDALRKNSGRQGSAFAGTFDEV